MIRNVARWAGSVVVVATIVAGCHAIGGFEDFERGDGLSDAAVSGSGGTPGVGGAGGAGRGGLSTIGGNGGNGGAGTGGGASVNCGEQKTYCDAEVLRSCTTNEVILDCNDCRYKVPGGSATGLATTCIDRQGSCFTCPDSKPWTGPGCYFGGGPPVCPGVAGDGGLGSGGGSGTGGVGNGGSPASTGGTAGTGGSPPPNGGTAGTGGLGNGGGPPPNGGTAGTGGLGNGGSQPPTGGTAGTGGLSNTGGSQPPTGGTAGTGGAQTGGAPNGGCPPVTGGRGGQGGGTAGIGGGPPPTGGCAGTAGTGGGGGNPNAGKVRCEGSGVPVDCAISSGSVCCHTKTNATALCVSASVCSTPTYAPFTCDGQEDCPGSFCCAGLNGSSCKASCTAQEYRLNCSGRHNCGPSQDCCFDTQLTRSTLCVATGTCPGSAFKACSSDSECVSPATCVQEVSEILVCGGLG